MVWIDPARIPGQRLREVVGDALYEQIAPAVRRVLAGERVEFEREEHLSEGVRYSHAQYIPALVDGEVHGFYAIVYDITEQKLLALSDPLTGLPNG